MKFYKNNYEYKQMWFIASAIILLLKKREASEEIINHGKTGLAKVTMNISLYAISFI